jgi:hypothetical protein
MRNEPMNRQKHIKKKKEIDQPPLEISSSVISAIGLLLKMMKEFVSSHFFPVRCC